MSGPSKKRGLVPDAGVTVAAAVATSVIAHQHARSSAQHNPELSRSLIARNSVKVAEYVVMYVVGVVFPLALLLMVAGGHDTLPDVTAIYVLGCVGWAGIVAMRLLGRMVQRADQHAVYRLPTSWVIGLGFVWAWPGGIVAFIAYSIHTMP